MTESLASVCLADLLMTNLFAEDGEEGMENDLGILYAHALDEHNNSISIEALSLKDKTKKFKCPHCKGTLSPRALHPNAKKQKHFYHPNYKSGYQSTAICNRETYLHATSKLLLLEEINRSNNFCIEYKSKSICKNEASTSRCSKVVTKKIEIGKDFKKEIEKWDGEESLRPDILIIDNRGGKIYIEIKVSSSVSQKKVDSGIRIIEIDVQSIKIIEKICRDHSIVEDKKNIVFYNFPKEDTFDCKGACEFVKEQSFKILKPLDKKKNKRYHENMGNRDSADQRVGFFNLMNEKYAPYVEELGGYRVIYPTSMKKDRHYPFIFVSYNNDFFYIDHKSKTVYTVIDDNVIILSSLFSGVGIEPQIRALVDEKNNAF